MTDILLVCDKEGCFRSVTALGHASFARKGKDIVCAAETIVLRTVLNVLKNTEGVNVNANTASRGTLAFSVEASVSSVEITERLKCMADFVREALTSLSEEYPEYVHLREITEE